MKSRLLLFLFAGIFSGFVSCKKDDDSEQKALEKRIFDAYIENNDITVSPTASGLYYLEEVAGTGIHPDSGDWVLIDYDLYLIDGENLIFSSNKDKAVEYSLYDERILYGGSKFHLGTNLQGFDEGLLMMKEGGKASLIFMSDLGYGSFSNGLIGPYSSLKFDISLLKVIPDPVIYEKNMIIDYINNNSLTNIDTTSTGLYYIETVEGAGDTVYSNSVVTINVEGYLLDGRKFMEEESFQFQMGNYGYSVTPGLKEGVSYMKEGGKAKLIVPYYLGYGPDGKNYYEGTVKVPISPYSTLVYDIELITTN